MLIPKFSKQDALLGLLLLNVLLLVAAFIKDGIEYTVACILCSLVTLKYHKKVTKERAEDDNLAE